MIKEVFSRFVGKQHSPKTCAVWFHFNKLLVTVCAFVVGPPVLDTFLQKLIDIDGTGWLLNHQ